MVLWNEYWEDEKHMDEIRFASLGRHGWSGWVYHEKTWSDGQVSTCWTRDDVIHMDDFVDVPSVSNGSAMQTPSDPDSKTWSEYDSDLSCTADVYYFDENGNLIFKPEELS